MTADIGLDDLQEYVSTINPYSDSFIEIYSKNGSPIVNDESHTEKDDTIIVRDNAEVGWTVELALPFAYLIRGDTGNAFIIATIVLSTIVIIYLVNMVLRRMQDKSEEKYMSILDALSAKYDVMYRIDLESGTTEFVKGDENARRFFKVFETSSEDEMFENFYKYYVDAIVHEDDRATVKAVMNVANMHARLKNSAEMKVTYRAMRNQVDYVYSEMSIIKAGEKDDNLTSAILAFKIVDEVVRKQLADEDNLKKALSTAETASKAKTSFLFNMSHDIRTPMNAITGYTTMAKKYNDNPQLNEYLDKIEISSQHLLSLVNQVLEMSRIESGKIVLSENPCDVIERALAMKTIVAADSNNKDLKYRLHIGEITHKNVLVDTSRVNQIFTSILGNAIKYTPNGGSIDYSIEEQPCDKPGYGLYVVTVSDTGIGMSEEYLAHIFEEFTRENTSTVSNIQGTGLGMPIVKKLVDLMEGTIDIKSKQNVGTTVTVALPMKWDENLVASEKETAANEELSLKGRRILLVEDNEMNREIATEILEDAGATVDTAEDGDIAVDMVDNHDAKFYDCILMDIQMPRMNGYEATRAIRALLPLDVHIPIIALSANAFEEDKQKSLEAGMDDHVAKPIDIEQLKATIAKFV